MTSSFANSITLSSIDKLVLDAFLNVGWFRNGNKIFTTQFLHHNGIIHDAIWLRIKLEKFKLSKSQQTQLKKLEKFTIQYDRFSLNDEKENLFKKYKTTAHFIKSQDLFYVLYDHEKNEIFDSQEICIYDGKKLVAFGVYDNGQNSSAGITCIYDPDYKKYSLGISLMLLKISKLQQDGYKYFYPGYVAPGFTVFDYKLKLSKSDTEFYDITTGSWQVLLNSNHLPSKIGLQNNKLSSLSNKFTLKGINNVLCWYPYFDAPLNSTFENLHAIQHPLFLLVKNYTHENDFSLIVIYDVFSDTYKILECYIIGFPTIPIEGQNFYSKAILEVNDVLATFENLHDDLIQDLLKLSQPH